MLKTQICVTRPQYFNRVFLVLCVMKTVCGLHLGVYFIVLFMKLVKQNGNELLSSVRKCEALWAGLTVLEQNNICTSYTPPFWHCDHALFALLGMQLFFLPILLILVIDLCVLAFNPLNAELNPICCLLALLAHHFLHVGRIRVKLLTLRLLMSYIYIYIYIYIWSTYSWCF